MTLDEFKKECDTIVADHKQRIEKLFVKAHAANLDEDLCVVIFNKAMDKVVNGPN